MDVRQFTKHKISTIFKSRRRLYDEHSNVEVQFNRKIESQYYNVGVTTERPTVLPKNAQGIACRRPIYNVRGVWIK